MRSRHRISSLLGAGIALVLAVVLSVAAHASAQLADTSGSHDHPLIHPYPGRVEESRASRGAVDDRRDPQAAGHPAEY